MGQIDTGEVEPMLPGHWISIPCSIGGWHVYMALDQHRYCIICGDDSAPPSGDRGEYLESYARPDGLYEHIYGPGPRVKAAEKKPAGSIVLTRRVASLPT
jgi:hypothetical protein